MSFVHSLGQGPIRDLVQAERLVQEALDLYRALGDLRGQARSLWAVSNIHLVEEHWVEGLHAAREALDLFRELDDPYDTGWAAHSVGFSATQLGRFEEAREALIESLSIFRSANDVSGIAVLLADFSVLEAFSGNRERGARLRGAALAAVQATGGGLVIRLETVFPRVAATLQGLLPEDEYRPFLDEGAAMGMSQAAAYALGGDGPPE